MLDRSTYVFFKLLGEMFAIDVKNVIETIDLPELTPVPETPEFMKGVTVFRGNMLPVIDLKLKFKFKEESAGKTYVIVVTYTHDDKQQDIGLIVDKIVDVKDLSVLDINDFPDIGSKYNLEFIDGIVKHKENITIILNIEKILSSIEIDIIKKSTDDFDLLKDEKKINGDEQ